MSKKGENIFKRKDGRWEARYIHHYENGKAKYHYIYGATYQEAKAKKLAAQTLPECHHFPAVKRLATFDLVADLWLADIKISVRESTYTRYNRIVTKYLFPLLEKQQLLKIDQKYISGLTQQLLKRGGVHQSPLSPKTVSDIICVMKSIFKFGKENGYPCPNLNQLKYPQKAHREIEILTDDKRKAIENCLLNSHDPISLGVLFALFTGVRIGELCGLRWEDIDFNNGIIYIRRTIERIPDLDPLSPQKTKVIISEPKTENSFRIIPLPSFLAAYMKKQQQDGCCYLLTGSKDYTEPHQYYVRYQKLLNRNHINAHTFHSLRHTFATRCVENGFDVKSLSEILGHASVTTTLEIYVHPSLKQKKAQMERLTP